MAAPQVAVLRSYMHRDRLVTGMGHENTGHQGGEQRSGQPGPAHASPKQEEGVREASQAGEEQADGVTGT